jgi:hypothetical protein
MRRYDFYTRDNLDIIIQKDNAKIININDKITRKSIVNFICNCGKECSKGIYYIFKSNNAICKKCSKDIALNKTKNTFIEKYGVENVFQANIIKDRIKKTLLEKYSVEYPSQNKEVRDKMKKTCIEKYGVENPMFNTKVKEKQKSTIIEKYGAEHISQTQDFKEKVKQTCLKKYNVEYVSQTPEFREKVKQSFIENYGVDNPNKVAEIREKIRKTNLERYNVEYPSQNQEIQERTQKNAKKYKEYKMPSGTIIKVQGYEPFALDELIKIYTEEDIICNRKNIPRITYKIGDKQKYYFPDIYIPSKNMIIEVKSSWTYKCKEDNIQEKAEATKAAGYEYEIWIYDSKGNKTLK